MRVGGGWGCRLNIAKKISLNFLFKEMLFACFGLQVDLKQIVLDFPSKVTSFANFGLNVDLK